MLGWGKVAQERVEEGRGKNKWYQLSSKRQHARLRERDNAIGQVEHAQNGENLAKMGQTFQTYGASV